MSDKDFFIERLDVDGLPLETAELLRIALEESFGMTVQGLDWSNRPYAKKWYLPRRGRSGILGILNDMPLAPRDKVYVLRSDQEQIISNNVQMVFKNILKFLKTGTMLLIIPENGKWLIEFDLNGYLYFDYSIPDERTFTGYFGACPI